MGETRNPCDCRTPVDRARHVIDGGNLPISGRWLETIRAAAKAEIEDAMDQARREANEEAAKNVPEGTKLIVKCYFEIAEELIGEDEVRRRFNERFAAALQARGGERGG